MSPQGTLWRQMQLWFKFTVFQYKTCPSPSWHLFAIIYRFLRRNVPFSVKPQMISQGILNEEGLWDHLTPDPYFRIPDLIYVQLGQGHSADWHEVQRENPGPPPSGAIYTLCVITPIMLLKSAENSNFVSSEPGVKNRKSLPPTTPHTVLFPLFWLPVPSLPSPSLPSLGHFVTPSLVSQVIHI